MGTTKKVKYMVANGTDYDMYAFETTSDQIKEGVLTTESQLSNGTDTQLVSAKLIRDALNKKANQADISNGLVYKGSCLYSELPSSNNGVGDFYYTTDEQHYYTWNESTWNDTGIGVGDVVSKEEYNEGVENINNDISELKEDLSNKITKFYASNQGEICINDSDNGKIQDMMIYGKSSQDGAPTPENPSEIKSVVNPTVKVCGSNFYSGSDLIGLTNPYTTDFIPVILYNGKLCISFDAFSDTSNGNYVVSVQYFDANKEITGGNGKADEIGNNISHASIEFDGSKAGDNNEDLNLQNISYVKIAFGIYNATATEITFKNIMISATVSDFEPYKPIQTVTIPYTLNAIPVKSGGNVTIDGQKYISDYVDVERGKLVRIVDSSKLDNTQSIVDKTEWLLAEPQEIDFTTEEITAFKALVTYYPTTNISVNSEQLDGYTVFNYPISMANGWNYVKKQLNDNRDYIYDMDIQSVEAYVNSEYAVALTELEV